jgi:hypothetical protein
VRGRAHSLAGGTYSTTAALVFVRPAASATIQATLAATDLDAATPIDAGGIRVATRAAAAGLVLLAAAELTATAKIPEATLAVATRLATALFATANQPVRTTETAAHRLTVAAGIPGAARGGWIAFRVAALGDAVGTEAVETVGRATVAVLSAGLTIRFAASPIGAADGAGGTAGGAALTLALSGTTRAGRTDEALPGVAVQQVSAWCYGYGGR